MEVTTFMANVNMLRAVGVLFVAYNLSTYKWPVHKDVTNNSTFDYIIVGAGTAGCVLANRLTQSPEVNVLLIEAGGDPSFESEIPSLFAYLTETKLDWNFTSVDDGYSAQNSPNKYLNMPAGRGLGGSSQIHHFYHLRGHSSDFKSWVTTTGDESWSFENLLPYFIRSERLEDDYILNSNLSDYHGTNGYIGLTREKRESINKYLKAFGEVGNNIVEDLNTGDTLGFSPPTFSMSKGLRQGGALSYLSPIKKRPNLHVMKNTMVTKVIFDDDKQATGVECTTSDGSSITVNARKETILSAGAINTPKLLMLSGIGPETILDDLNITSIVNLPVGEGLQDHMAVILFHLLENITESAAASDPGLFPVPSIVGYSAVNKSQNKPEYFTMTLEVSNYPAAMMLLGSVVFQINSTIINQMYEASTNREAIFTVLALSRPDSTGKVVINSTDPTVAPLIYTGFLSNDTDLNRYVAAIEDYNRVTNSTYFKSVGGETQYFNFDDCTATTPREYWKCYVLNMMGTTLHYSSTCAMGSVLDSKMLVHGVSKLRVVDASAMPNVCSGNINAVVLALAEKAADLIKENHCTA